VPPRLPLAYHTSVMSVTSDSSGARSGSQAAYSSVHDPGSEACPATPDVELGRLPTPLRNC